MSIEIYKTENKHIISSNLYNTNELVVTFEGEDTKSVYLNILPSNITGNITPELFQPLSAVYEHDEYIDFKNTTFTTLSGYTFNQSPLFQNIKDISSNKQTNFYLTSSTDLFKFIQDSADASEYALTFILSGLDGFTNINDYTGEIFLNNKSVTEDSILQLERDQLGDYKIWRGEKAFTTNSLSPHTITLQDPVDNDSQKFIMTISDDSVIIKSKLTDTFVSYNTAYQLEANDTETTFGLVNWQGLYKVTGFTDRGNDFVVYYNNQSTPDQNRLATIDHSRSLSGALQNYLISLPYKTQIEDNKIKVNFAGLKNIEHVEGEYTFVPIISNDQAIFDTKLENLKIREYDKIFTGTSQDGGYENLHLGYATEFAKPVYLEPDKTTYFHYPEQAPQLPLSAVGLQYIGAAAGTTPNRSDRIYKKMANYKKNIWWGNSRQWQTGTWLCSWLSGSPTSTDAVWMDRWYWHGVTFQEAITTTNVIIDDVDPIVFDIPTQMTFDPGVWYKYIHIGNNANQFIVDSFSGPNQENLKLWYEYWDETTEDLSKYNNNGTIEHWGSGDIALLDISTKNTAEQSLLLNGNNFVNIPFAENYNSNEDLSVNFWVYNNDWNGAKTAPFVGNYFRGGWRVGYTNNFSNPVFYTMDAHYGHVIPYNVQGRPIGDYILPNEGEVYSTPTDLVVDAKHYAYIYEKERNAIYKMDYDGSILQQLTFTEPILEHIELAPSGNQDLLYVATSAGMVSAFETNCLDYYQSYYYGSVLTTFTLNTSGDFIGHNGYKKIIVDNENIVWGLSSEGLFKADGMGGGFDTLILSDISLLDIACDMKNNIWGVRPGGSYFKLDLINRTVLEGDLDLEQDEDWSISFTYEWIPKSSNVCDVIIGADSGAYNTFIYIANKTTGKIYKITETGKDVRTLIPSNYVNLNKYPDHDIRLMKFFIGNDFAGYDYHRKHRYIRNNQEPQIYLEYDYFAPDMISPQTQRIYYSAKDLPRTWHQIAFAFDYENSIMSFYIDTLLVGQVVHNHGTYIYRKYNSSLVIGKDADTRISQDNRLHITGYGYEGKFAGLRIYDNVVNNSDLKHIILTKFDFTTITWAMPTGMQNILEEVERFFKHKLPGMKSQFFNVHVVGLEIEDKDTRELIEQSIRESVAKLAPAYTELYKVIWD